MKFRFVLLIAMSLLILSFVNLYIERPNSYLFDNLIAAHRNGETALNAPVDLLLDSTSQLQSLELEVSDLLSDGFYLTGFYVDNIYVFNPRQSESICEKFQNLAEPIGSLSLQKEIDIFLREYAIKIFINPECQIIEVKGFKLKPGHP